MKLKEKGFPSSCLCASRSAVSLFSRIAYGEDIGKVLIIMTLFRSFHKSHKQRTPVTYMCSLSLIFNYYNSQQDNNFLSFFDLTVTYILLNTLFTACRFHELEQISMSKSIFDSEAIHFHAKIKTSLPPSYLTVPYLKKLDVKVCQVNTIICLWERAKRTYESRDTFLLNTTHHTPLKTSGIRKLARLGMTQVGIPEEFRPYTI